MAEYYRSEAKSGCFIALATAIGVAFLFWISGAQVLSNTESYRVQFDDATGVTSKTPVRIAGKTIGQVSSVGLTPDRTKAELILEIERSVDIYNNATFTVQSSSLLGGRYVALFPGTSDYGAADPTTAVFAGTSASDIGQLFQTAEGAIGELQTMISVTTSTLENFKGYEDELLVNLNKSLANFAELSKSTSDLVASNQEQLDATIENVSVITEEMRAMLEENRELIHDLLKNGNQQIVRLSDATVEAMELFQEHLGNRVTVLLDRMNDLVGELHRTLLINTPSVQEIVDNAKAMTENMARFSARIAADPSLLIFGSGDDGQSDEELARLSEQRLRDQGRLPLMDKRE